MADWRLTPDGEKVLAEWMQTATAAHKQRIAEVLESIEAGSWKGRWWNQPYPPNTNIAEIRPGDGLIVLVHDLELQSAKPDGLRWIDLLRIHVVDRDDADLPIVEGSD